ncbi:putative heterokaryon incompatibility protein [Rosellinia necatrix]|uniref:Putative heterokaryon incompatibility protein n=1 Tax=Rosellinia necatrix TaxID=77044 RepID=A0A1S7UHQ0_ROSNE|nr:putative heterokaryon incompatibility protein [Rosellinia necatrix]
MDWHDTSCRRLDLISHEGVASCLRCGSFSQAAPAHQFPPISKQTDFRLLRLSPGPFDQDIRCEICVYDISSRPGYEAVSYTWADENGNDELCRTIFVSGKPFSVTRNCENALKRMRRPDRARVLWIDAICINQDDKNERGHQVHLMPKIYAGASGVLIYLGEHAHDSDHCLHALVSDESQWFSSEENLRVYTALSHLLSRRYFSRAWVLQEVALARQATLFCGGRRIEWSRLCKAELAFPSSHGEIPRLLDTPIITISQPELYTTPDRLLDLLDISRKCEARDPRDKVYAILGLVLDHHSQGLAADYNLGVRDLFVKVALALASRHGWGQVLCRAGIESRSVKDLPSWAPDWSSPFKGVPSHGDISYTLSRPGLVSYDEKDNSIGIKAWYIGPANDKIICLLNVDLCEPARSDTVSQHLCLGSYMSRVFRQPQQFALPDLFIPLELPSAESIYNRVTNTINSNWHVNAYAGRLLGFKFLPVQGMVKSLMVTRPREVERKLRALLHDGHDIGEWSRLITQSPQPDFEISSDAWETVEARVSEDLLQEVIRYESSHPPHEFDALWRNRIILSPERQTLLKMANYDYELLMDFNEAFWKLILRLCLCKEVTIKVV